jgi:hypothetical protein
VGPFPFIRNSAKRGGNYIVWDGRELTILLAAFETRTLRTEFLIGDRGIPNHVEVTAIK